MCQKCGERRVGRSEWGISLYPLVDIIPSLRINSPRQREMRKERAQAEGGGGGGTEMVVVLICQRNTALRVLLKRPHKPELSGVGGHILTFGHTDVDCEFSAWLSCTQSYPSTSCGNRRMGPGSSHWPIHLNFLQSSDNKSELRVQSVAFYGAFKCICQYSSADFA